MARSVDDRAIRLVVGRQHVGCIGGGEQPPRPEPVAGRHPWIALHAALIGFQAYQACMWSRACVRVQACMFCQALLACEGTDHRLRLRLRAP